ncbi:MAG: NADH-quinone oxidoreductase subunit L [Actinomycetota bacterium]|nr:NADH-quinone oxidoreductase subunit L [Actinomycetota bacterium]
MLTEYAWLIPVAPFLSFLTIVLLGKRLPKRGAEIGIAAVGFSFLYGTALWVSNIASPLDLQSSVELARVGPLVLEAGWVLDGLSTMMLVVVGLVSLMVHVYSVGYMEGDRRFTFFFGALSLFTGSMLLLVLAPNLVQLLVGWELVGLCSYLLIGHWWEEHVNSSSAIKAFITTKSADVGFLIGIFVLAAAVGSFRIDEVLEAAEAGALGPGVAVAGAVLLFIGAMGKSAQFPLHTWLPDAMAGPTPVSALIHAATMVTAGVYMVARMFPLYEQVATEARMVVLVIGTITLLIAGLLAMVQDDIKRVLAYSTVSQLGYMMAALGAAAFTAAMFHLFTHAFFKALLFLGSGSVIHAVHSNDMSDMGGLRKHLPTTFWTFVVGSLALAGVPPLAGFFSKDEILAGFSEEGFVLVLAIGVFTALLTALYMARVVFLTFYGEYKGQGHPHESPAIMTVPLVVLAVLSVVAGWVNVPGVFTGFAHWVQTAFVEGHAAEHFDFLALLLGLAAATAGIGLGYLLYFHDADTQQGRDRLRVPYLWPLLHRKYYLDDLYWHGVVRPVRDPLSRGVNWSNDYLLDGAVNGTGLFTGWLARFVYGDLDQRGIDLAINGVSVVTGGFGGALRYLQTGKVQQYAAALFGGAVLLVVALLLFG